MNLYKYHEILGIMMKARNYELSEKILDKIEKNVIICPQNQKIMNDNLMNITRKCLMSELDLWSNEDFNVDEIGNHILKGINLKDCTFKENDPYDLAIGAISHEYLNEFSSQLGYSVYDKVMLERND